MRHVRTPEGSAHFKLPIGSPLTGHHLDALPNGAKVAFGGHLFQRVEGDDGAGRWNNTTGDPRDSVHHDVMRFFARHGQVHNPADPEAPKPVGAPAAKASGPTSESRDYRADPRYQPVPVKQDPKVVARLKAEQAARGKVPAGASPDPKKWGTATPAEQARNRAIREAWNNRPEAQGGPSSAAEKATSLKSKRRWAA